MILFGQWALPENLTNFSSFLPHLILGVTRKMGVNKFLTGIQPNHGEKFCEYLLKYARDYDIM